MGIIVQLGAETLTALFAMMQRAQGPQRQYVSVYHVPDADREKEAGHRRTWSNPVKVKHWEEHGDTHTHIFFRESVTTKTVKFRFSGSQVPFLWFLLRRQRTVLPHFKVRVMPATTSAYNQ